MVIATFLLASILAGNTASKAPAWLEHSMAGYTQKYDDTHYPICIQDPSTGFFIVRNVECDGAHQDLILTRDRGVIQKYGYSLVKSETTNLPTRKALKSLSTAHGVTIGDSVTDVMSKLGAPTRAHRGSPYEILKYAWKDVVKGVGAIYTQQYVFKAGKLIEISLNRESVPGC